MKKITCLIFILACSIFAFGQVSKNRQISGKIKSASTNDPLAGATIVVMKPIYGASTTDSLGNVIQTITGYTPSTIGSFSDANGMFLMNVPKDPDLAIEISYIGLKTELIPLTSNLRYEVKLRNEAIAIQTVVVSVPYNKLKKESFTGSMATLNSDKIGTTTETSFDKALQGQVPGIVMSSASGQPGSTSQIQLRGMGSISAGSEPLIVVDGVPIFSGKATQYSTNTSILSTLNPNDIENVSVLKDASATSLYGSRASNGVILITTKQGKKGKTKYNFSTSQGVGTIELNNFKLLNSQEYIDLQTQSMRNAGILEEKIDEFLLENTGDINWIDEVYRPAWYQNYEFSTTGGDDKTTFYISSNYKDEQGIVTGTDLQRFSARLNITNKASKKCIFGLKFNPSYTTQNLTEAPGVLSSPVTSSLIAAPTNPVYKNNDYNFSNNFYNPVGIIALNKNFNTGKYFLGNAFIQYNITPYIEFRTVENVDYINMKEDIFRHPRTPDGSTVNGMSEVYITEIMTYTTSNTLKWSKSYSNTHFFEILGGFEMESSTKQKSNFKASNFPLENVSSIYAAAKMEQINSKQTNYSLKSVLSNLQYNYKSKYFVSASYRNDGSSRFSPHHRWASFWSIGSSWLISNEEFIKDIKQIQHIKLRSSYGTSGNSEIEEYAYMQLYDFGQNYNGNPGSSPKQKGNDNLTWEKNNNLNIGIDATVYKRFDLSIDAYHRTTYDLLLNVPLSMTTGYTHQIQNVGAMVNKGLEFLLRVEIYDKKNINWISTLTFSKNINTITQLYSRDKQDTIIEPNSTKIKTEGQALQSFYLAEWAGVNSADGSPLWYDVNGNLTKEYNKARKVLAGTADPKFVAGLDNTIKYKDFSLSFLWYLNYGNLIFNQLNTELLSDGAISGKNQLSSSLDYWERPGDISENPKLVQNNGSNSNEFSTRYLEDGTYLRLKNIQLNYSIPQAKLTSHKIQALSVFIQAQNLYVWTKFSGMDPETRSNGVYYYDYPKQRLFTTGVSVKF